MDAILKRRSIRKFLDQPIPEEALEKILRAGMAAPSAGGSAEWEFVLFADPKKKEALMEVSEYAFPVKTAPVCMVVCGNLDREIHKDRGWWVQRSHGKHAAGGNGSGHRQYLAGHLPV